MAINSKQVKPIAGDAAGAKAAVPEASNEPQASGEGFENTVVAVLSKAIEAHKGGRLADAETGYRRVLEMSPDHPHAIHFLGVLEHQKGNNEEAIALIKQAIDILPEFADAYSNLGAAFHAMKQLQDAEDSFRKAAELKPNLAEAHSNLAAILMERGRQAEAVDAYKTAYALAPLNPKFSKRLGDLFLEAEQFEDAIEWFEKFIQCGTDNGEISNNLGYAYEQVGRLEKAEEWYRKAAGLSPDSPEINNNLANALESLGRSDEAVPYFANALNFDPSKWEDLATLAGTYINRGDPQRGVAIYEQIIDAGNTNAKIYNDYAVALSKSGRVQEAEDNYLRAIELNPDFAEAYNNLGSNILIKGRRLEAIEHFKKAIELRPEFTSAYINLCHTLANAQRLDEAYLYAQAVTMMPDYQPGMFSNPNKVFRMACDFDAIDALGDPWENVQLAKKGDFSTTFLEMLVLADTEEKIDRLAALHREWGDDLQRKSSGNELPPLTEGAHTGKIRIGIISSDLRHHSVAKFVMPVIENYDPDRFEIYCYSPIEEENDQVQQKIKGIVDAFKIVADVADHEFAEIIRADKIDILFELNGFTRDTRLQVLAYKPAPVQIYWLGYPFTTGVSAIDYILLDPHVNPVREDWMVEKSLLMPESWVCFGGFREEPISEQIPCERTGMVTFGSMNNPYKVTREAIAVWSRILQEVPESRFLYVRPELASMVLCTNLVKEFGRHGIGPERLFLVNNWKTKLSHFSYYDEIDITLDTFPLVGGTTTCDALWMGTPLITKYGPSMHQRMGYSILRNIGLQDLCVENDDDYVEKAVALANDRESLALLRRELRPALRASALCRSEDYARNFFGLMDELIGRHGLR